MQSFPIAPGGLPVSESLPERILCLPMHPYLTDEDMERIIGAVAEFHGGAELRRATGTTQPPPAASASPPPPARARTWR